MVCRTTSLIRLDGTISSVELVAIAPWRPNRDRVSTRIKHIEVEHLSPADQGGTSRHVRAMSARRGEAASICSSELFDRDPTRTWIVQRRMCPLTQTGV